MPAPSITVSMKMPQKTPSAVMILRLRFRAMVCQISFQRSVSKKDMVRAICYVVIFYAPLHRPSGAYAVSLPEGGSGWGQICK